jgi:peptide/nickel transport system substrate-binding protein
MGDVSKDDLEGPKIDRRTTLKLLGAGGMTTAAASLAGCMGGGGSTEGSNDENNNADTQSDQDTQDDADTEPAQQGGSITAGWALDAIEMLDPHYVDLYQQITIFSNIFSGITKINSEGEIVGDLAKDWTLPDETTYEFQLHEGVTFHNGDTLDAEAAKWSIERLMNSDDSPHVGKVEPIESVEAPDSTTLRINLKEPTAPFITFMTRGPGRAGTIVNKTAVENDPEKYQRKPVGSGPFKLTERSQGESLTLEAFDDYWETDDNGNQLPHLDEVTINLIPEPSTMWTALKTDEIQYTDEIPPQNAKLSKKLDKIEVTGANAGEWSSISMLCNDPASDEWREKQAYASGNEQPSDYWNDKDLVTSNKKVRQAVAKAIDREGIVEKAHFGFAEPAHSIINPSIAWAYDEKPDNAQEYDPEGAKQLLDEAGYTGEPRFTARILGTPADKRLMTVVQEQLGKVGIDLELDVQQESSFWDNIYRYNHMFQVYGGGGDIDPWMSWWKQLKTPQENGSSGAWQKNLYSNEEFDELLEESFVTPALDERRKIVKQAEQVFLEDVPYATTTFPLTPKGRQASLTGVGNQVGLSNFHRASLEK